MPSDNRALSKFDISENRLYTAGAKAISEGLKGNQVMTELNLAGNKMGKRTPGWYGESDMSGVTALADAISDMKALSKFTFSGDGYCRYSKPVTMETCMVEADFSGKGEGGLGESGAIMAAAFLSKCT
jgi:hypothetical protein